MDAGMCCDSAGDFRSQMLFRNSILSTPVIGAYDWQDIASDSLDMFE